jgi:hypothetical protein
VGRAFVWWLEEAQGLSSLELSAPGARGEELVRCRKPPAVPPVAKLGLPAARGGETATGEGPVGWDK